ncbi:KGK domain-containing protein [Aerosakkonemataceae cyanobacterium BLCC-F50]|uniref:KGK domain-containing protein n=1 Tax=Floridaenema flaviceps BLCC-F50 TaxID=3153642 RepID=A0ABV4Y200_9CYAN
MEYNYYLQNCSNDDVIQFSNAIHKIGQLKTAMELAANNENKLPYTLFCALKEQGVTLESLVATQKLFADGLDAETLKIGAKGWQKGKIRVRVTLEFEPEEPESNEPESPLDDLRRMMNENS